MAAIICEIHGEHVASFVSEHHAKKILKMKKSLDSEVLYIEVLDKKELFNGKYMIDPYLASEIGIKGLTINIQSEFEKFEMMFNKLTPICPKCLDFYLGKE